MNSLSILSSILKNQNEIKNFGYFVQLQDDGKIKMELSASGVSRKMKFKNIDECLNKIVTILHDLKKLEAYYLSKN